MLILPSDEPHTQGDAVAGTAVAGREGRADAQEKRFGEEDTTPRPARCGLGRALGRSTVGHTEGWGCIQSAWVLNNARLIYASIILLCLILNAFSMCSA